MSSSLLTLEDSPELLHDISEANLAKALQAFTTLLGAPHVTHDDAAVLESRSGSLWSPAGPSEKPHIVVRPGTTEDVSRIVAICAQQRIPVYAYSGGTGLGGATVATRGGVCVDLGRMDRIVALHEVDMDVVVQPAVGWQELNEYLAPRGLFFPPDPAPGAKIGGMIAMHCSGTNAYRYGTMSSWVISLTAVLADGTVIKTRNRPRKSSAGYDLTHLLIGAEGTLGIVTEAILKLTPLPPNLHVAVAAFPNTQSAVQSCIALINSGQQLDALEFVDENSMRALNISGLSSVRWPEQPSVFMKLAGGVAAMDALKALVTETCAAHGCLELKLSEAAADVEAWWHARKSVARALLSVKEAPEDPFVSGDAAVPVSRLVESIEETHRLSKDLGFFCSTIGHIGDGNVHTVVICKAADKHKADKLLDDVRLLALKLDGTITGEHGIATSLKHMLPQEIGQSGVDLLRRIKLSLDPLGILNPDKILDLKYGTVQ